MGKFFKITLPFLLAATCVAPCSSQTLSADTAKIKSYLLIADKHYATDELDSAVFYCLKAGDLARAMNYKKGIADYISFYIPVLNRQGKYALALELGLEALKVCEELGNNTLLAQAYNNLGNEYQYMGDLKSAATNYLNAMIFSEGTNLPHRQQRYTNNLASVFLQMDETNKSFYYANKAYDLARKINDSVGMASSLVNVALNEIMTKKFDDAVVHLDLVLKLGKALDDDSYVLDSYINRADVESAKGNYPGALKFYKKSLEVVNSYPAPDYQLYVYWGLAKNYYFVGSYSEANAHLEKSIQIGKELNALQELRKIYQLGSDINEKVGLYHVALNYRKQYEHINDSLASAETQQNIHKLETEYRTAQKEKAIAEKNLIIANNDTQIQKKNKLIYLSIAIVVALVSAIIMFILIYRNRQRTLLKELKLREKQNELKVLTATIEGQEKERARLARELHDGVGGILSAAKMHLSIVTQHPAGTDDAAEADHVMSMIDQASREIRTIAHNLSPDVIIMNELDNAIINFCQRVQSEKLRIDHYILGTIPRLKTGFKLLVYRAVQELINNIIKHSEATHAIVQLSLNNDLLLITVEDNGVGFNPGEIKGIGLLNLRSRITDVQGEMNIESEPGKGTTVYLEFDIANYQEKALPLASITA